MKEAIFHYMLPCLYYRASDSIRDALVIIQKVANAVEGIDFPTRKGPFSLSWETPILSKVSISVEHLSSDSDFGRYSNLLFDAAGLPDYFTVAPIFPDIFERSYVSIEKILSKRGVTFTKFPDKDRFYQIGKSE